MHTFHSYAPVFAKWPSMEAFGEDMGIDGAYARTLKARDALPSKYWLKVEQGAKKRGIRGVNIKLLAQIAAVKELPPSTSPGT